MGEGRGSSVTGPSSGLFLTTEKHYDWVDPSVGDEEEDKDESKDENENSTTKAKENDDDIPLIDSQPEVDENTEEKPGKLVRPHNIHFTNSGLDSPDIFHLRAPLVSCENILTPAISTDWLLD